MTAVNNNKVFFELLDGTSSGSEIQQLVIPPRKKRFRRRLRNNPNTRHEGHLADCRCNARTVSLTLFCLVLVCWLITLTWLAVVLNQDVFRLNADLKNLVAAHQGVPDALHQCHTLSQEVHKNQSAIVSQLSDLAAMLHTFSSNLTDVQTALSAVQQQLKTSPSLVNDPRLVKELSESVAKFGSKIQDLETTSTNLKEQDNKQDGLLNGLLGNLTDLHAQVASLALDRGGVTPSQLATEKDNLLRAINELAANVTLLNSTLSNKVQWTADDQKKDHVAIGNLEEMNQNMTARITTLEVMCVKPNTETVPPSAAPPKYVPPSNPSIRTNSPSPLLHVFSPDTTQDAVPNQPSSSSTRP